MVRKAVSQTFLRLDFHMAVEKYCARQNNKLENQKTQAVQRRLGLVLRVQN